MTKTLGLASFERIHQADPRLTKKGITIMRTSTACIASASAFALLMLVTALPSTAKTVRECDAEYTTKKAAIQASGQKKKDFITACRAGTTSSATGAAAPAPMQAAPTAAPVPMAPPPAASPTITRQRTPTPAPMQTTGAPAGANHFAREGEAKGGCLGGTVVWVNNKLKVYHFAGGREYGKTKSGAYMCEAPATPAGDRAAKNEKHP
jgi:hypothetical protein